MLKCIDNNGGVQLPGGGQAKKTWERDLGEIPIKCNVIPGKEPVFDVFVRLSIAYKVADKAMAVERVRQQAADIVANACEAGIANGVIEYGSVRNIQ